MQINKIEAYISEHSEAQFSHSICPDCMEILYPEIYKKMKKNENTSSIVSSSPPQNF